MPAHPISYKELERKLSIVGAHELLVVLNALDSYKVLKFTLLMVT